MNAVIVTVAAIGCFAVAYVFYGRVLKRQYGIDPSLQTPAHTFSDGVDFVPVKNWWVLFGHHFSSICGAGPIVGPVLACAYWGWGISALWLVAGAILMGAVADFSSLVISVKNEGKSIAELSGLVISPRVRTYFAVFIWIALILVNAVFAIFAAKTLIEEPDAVIPSLGLIPTAIFTGWLLYRTKVSTVKATLTGLGILAVLLVVGQYVQPRMPDMGRWHAETLWILILLTYCFIASVMPVQLLLQPRDYLASFILFALIGAGVLGLFFTHPLIKAPLVTSFIPAGWPTAGPLWPMLFVTIACGAISGFHSLVSSGTTCKQIATEQHACRVGYGGMLMESLVGVLVMVAVCAGLSFSELRGHLRSGGPIAAFGYGYAAVTEPLFGAYGKSFAILALNAFILTTLDTATRITRYITADLFKIKNPYLATAVVVAATMALALSGKWNLLWPAFGAANQLIAGIALLIASCWLLARGRNFYLALVPAIVMLVTTLAALGYQFVRAMARTDPATGAPLPDVSLAVIVFLLILLSLSIVRETVRVYQNRPAGKMQGVS